MSAERDVRVSVAAAVTLVEQGEQSVQRQKDTSQHECDDGDQMQRLTNLATASDAAEIPARARARMFVVTHVRQALQQTVVIGACSPYFPAARARGPVQMVFT